MNNILIWGSGSVYDEMLTLIKHYESEGQFHVVGITSNDCYYYNIDGYPFVEKKNLGSVDFDWIVVCAREEAVVRKEAVSLGIEEGMILSSRILSIPYFNFQKYNELVRSKITILANNCWGGMAYHQLGLKVRSPFFNMWELDREYVAFLKNAEYILKNEKLHFIEMKYVREFDVTYPIYDLAGMKLHMNHYHDRKSAESKWYERSARINWDNLFVMMYSDDLHCVEEFSGLPYKKKVCFTSLHVDMPNVFYIPLEKIAWQKMLWEVVNGSVVGQYKLYDLMELLISGKVTYTDRLKLV